MSTLTSKATYVGIRTPITSDIDPRIRYLQDVSKHAVINTGLLRGTYFHRE